VSTCHRRKAGWKRCRVGTMSLATSCDITRHHAIGSRWRKMSFDRRRCGRETRWREWERNTGGSRKRKGFPLHHCVLERRTLEAMDLGDACQTSEPWRIRPKFQFPRTDLELRLWFHHPISIHQCNGRYLSLLQHCCQVEIQSWIEGETYKNIWMIWPLVEAVMVWLLFCWIIST